MGRHRKRNRNRGWGKKRKGADSNPKGSYQRFGTDERFPSWQTNRRMEAYYAYQGLHNSYWDDKKDCYQDCRTDEDKTKEAIRWMKTIKRILPASFRIGLDTDPTVREKLQKEIDDMVGKKMELKLDDERIVAVDPSRRIPFVPYAYQLAVDRHTIRRNPALQTLFEWLKIQTEAGFISRQETVSMIPPIVLDVESHHQVLDMCAAPGSKTGQIFEIVSRIKTGEKEPVGCVVANDTDHKRGYMLVHQLKRIHSPAALVTSCDAQFFPLLWKKEQEGMFDRVLADVPCSGDGTMRKNPMVWKNWSSLNSYGLHPLQLALAINGARLTKVGGYLCYSTCAMNPIENEAVVAELIRTTDGALEIVDRRPELKGIKARAGWSTWKVLRENKSRREVKDKQKKNNEKMQERRRQFDEHGERTWEKDGSAEKDKVDETNFEEKVKGTTSEEQEKNTEEKKTLSISESTDVEKPSEKKEGSKIEPLGPPPDWDTSTLKARCEAEGYIEYKSFEEVEERDKYTCRRSCFPPTEEEAKTMKLERCLRFLPHDMDTSGFFVTLLKKVKPLSFRARERAVKLVQQIRDDIADNEMDKESLLKKKAKNTNLDTKSIDKTDNNDCKLSQQTQSNTADDEDENSPPSKKMKLDGGRDSTKDVDVERGNSKGKINSKSRGNYGNDNFVLASESILDPLIKYYGFTKDFPKDQFMARAKPTSKVIYFVGKAVKRYMDGGLQDRIMMINTGLKAFERNNNECEVGYRVNQEGIHYLVPYMTTRKMIVDLEDFVKCIQIGAMKLELFSSGFAEQARKVSVGSFVVLLRGYEEDYSKKLMMVMWRCRGDHINCLVSKVEKLGMKSKLRAFFPSKNLVFADDEDNTLKKKVIKGDGKIDDGQLKPKVDGNDNSDRGNLES